jgi:hypothetical protein
MKQIHVQFASIVDKVYMLFVTEYHSEIFQIHDFMNRKQNITWNYVQQNIIWHDSESMIDIILDELKIYETNI